MERPLREHMAHLEQRIRELNQEIMQNRLTKEERNRMESEIRAAELALSYYRKALAIEHSLA
jgi:hypothetical protein